MTNNETNPTNSLFAFRTTCGDNAHRLFADSNAAAALERGIAYLTSDEHGKNFDVTAEVLAILYQFTESFAPSDTLEEGWLLVKEKALDTQGAVNKKDFEAAREPLLQLAAMAIKLVADLTAPEPVS